MFVSSGAAADSINTQLVKQRGLQGRVMWFDAEANIWALSKRSGVADIVAKCKEANINTIVVDVKPLSGLVLYNSKIAPRLERMDGRPYPRDYDLLQTVIEEGHRVGIKVHAAINVFSEGSQTLQGGPAFKHPEWQAVVYDMERSISLDDGTELPLDCTNQPPINGRICLYGTDYENTGNLPEGSYYARITHEGKPMQHGSVVGKAQLAAPDNGFLLVGTDNQADWLEQAVDNGRQIKLTGSPVFRRTGEMKNVHSALFVNPLHPEARAYALGIISEICKNYAIDGLVLDRMRYPNIYADFSDISRAKFEEYTGKKIDNWPADVMTREAVPGNDIIKGPLFGQWLKFRAQVMHDFLAEARNIVKSEKPRASLGVYVGSWYPLYYDVGVNWGSRSNKPGYDWWPEGYEETGCADLVDYMCTGCYYTYPTRQEAVAAGEEEWKSVEAATEESVKAVKDDTFVYGSLYVYQYKTRADRFAQAIQQCLDKTQGCMIFDLVYIRDYNWWGVLKDAFRTPAQAPHDAAGLINHNNARAENQE